MQPRHLTSTPPRGQKFPNLRANVHSHKQHSPTSHSSADAPSSLSPLPTPGIYPSLAALVEHPSLHASYQLTLLTTNRRQTGSCAVLALQIARTHASSQLQPTTHGETMEVVKKSMPPRAWDSHMHVTSPDYPLAENAAYTPSLHSLEHAMSFEQSIGVSNIVLVQPSIYGNDNSCLLDALRTIGPRHGRGVVGIDPASITTEALQEWHELGVRGVRLNLKSVNAQFTEASLRETLQRYEKAIKPLNWVLELFIGMEDIVTLERAAEHLSVRMCIAHFGAPKLPAVEQRPARLDPYELAGFQSLVNLLRKGNTWVKISAAYRFDEDPEMRGIEAVAAELLKVAGKRMVFASDWPHTRFEGLDVRPFVKRCLQWTGEVGLTQQVFVTNAEELWDTEK